MKNVGVNEFGQENVEQEYMGDVWQLETGDEEVASDILSSICDKALKGDKDE